MKVLLTGLSADRLVDDSAAEPNLPAQAVPRCVTNLTQTAALPWTDVRFALRLGNALISGLPSA